jgi:integron integrase
MKEAQAIERLRQVLRLQHKALATEDSYVLWLRRYIKALSKMPPELLSEKKLEIFLTNLAQVHDVSASTQNQAFNAIVYFYKQVLGQPLGNIQALRATRPAHERHAPTVAETQALLQTVPNQGGYPTNLISRMLYGCGLRVSEPLNLRIKDIDLERLRLCIRGAKGGKDRVVAIPLSLIPELTQQMQLARVVWERDKQNGMPVMLPHALASKYPEYQFSWGWAWLFPAHNTCRDPRSGRIVRYRMHEVNVQRAIKQARRQLGICVLPHELRHGFASHSLERGANPRAIQQVMGHTSLETTMGYMHAEALSVPSPLDALPIILTGPGFQNTRSEPAAGACFHPPSTISAREPNSPASIHFWFQAARALHVVPFQAAPNRFRDLSPESPRSERIRREHHASRLHC